MRVVMNQQLESREHRPRIRDTGITSEDLPTPENLCWESRLDHFLQGCMTGTIAQQVKALAQTITIIASGQLTQGL